MSENKVMRIEASSSPVEENLRCSCGEFTGEDCGKVIGETGCTSLIFMPAYLVASHVAAGNWGSYPHNGSQKILISQECADYILHTDVYPSEDEANNPDMEEEEDFEPDQGIGDEEEWSDEDTNPRAKVFGF
jgi:hypothetical protein